MNDRTGVQCPKCGRELVETKESETKKYVHRMLQCPERKCSFTPVSEGLSRDGKKSLGRHR